MSEWLDESDIFVYPSVCEEAFGISVIEAMARGCIVVTFNKGGLPELIKDGVNGFLVTKADEESLARKLEEIIENKYNNQEIIKNAIETAKHFTIDNTIENLYKEYKKLLKE